MKKYQAVIMHGAHEGEADYMFEGPDDLMDRTPVRVMRAFMEYLDSTAGLGHIDYEINAAKRNREQRVVTILGDLVFAPDDVKPFMCMISEKKD
ncbi:hypothetical protein [Chachezhania sediminis]|uniref:hypothetical protein n=1 Tax=Chachezhania sediminis TaxID=2599291 RepID=UPI00131CF749|nr:hypothetical protein [Chachezhania sediminis]